MPSMFSTLASSISYFAVFSGFLFALPSLLATLFRQALLSRQMCYFLFTLGALLTAADLEYFFKIAERCQAENAVSFLFNVPENLIVPDYQKTNRLVCERPAAQATIANVREYGLLPTIDEFSGYRRNLVIRLAAIIAAIAGAAVLVLIKRKQTADSFINLLEDGPARYFFATAGLISVGLMFIPVMIRIVQIFFISG